MEDNVRAELPLTDDQDRASTFPRGFAVSLNSQRSIPISMFEYLLFLCLCPSLTGALVGFENVNAPNLAPADFDNKSQMRYIPTLGYFVCDSIR